MTAVMISVIAAAVTIVTLRVSNFHELDPAGTALRIATGVLAWELIVCLCWAAWNWRGSAGIGTLLRTGRFEKRQKPGRWTRALRWTRDTIALAAVVFGVLLIRFHNEPSAPSAAAEVLVAIKIVQAATSSLIITVDKAFTRTLESARRSQPPSKPKLVPVEEILSRPDIAGHRPYEPRHAPD
jgi:hypothetical protein